MNTWAPLWSGIVESSIWAEDDNVVKIFMTMLAIKDSDHVVRKTAYQLGQISRKSEQQVLDALKVLSSPDSKRLETQDFEGRRIQAVEDGWLMLNGAKYREMISKEMQKARNRRSQAAFRDRQKTTQPSCDDKPEPLDKTSKFTKPTIEEVEARCEEIGCSTIEGEKFFNYYESNGWKVGKNQMKNWHSALAGWKTRAGSNLFSGSPISLKSMTAEQRKQADEDLLREAMS